MAEWNETTLGEFISLQRGHDLPTTTREKGDIPVMGSFGVTGSHSVARVKGPGVTVGRSGASIGVVSYVGVDYWPLNTCLFATDFHGNNPRFAYYFLQTLDLASHNSGSAQPSLNRNYIAPIRISIPDRDTQDDIAGFLGGVDDKIELNRRMNETLEAMAQAIFRDWFADFGPTRRKLEGATDPVAILGGLIPTPEKAAPLAALFPAMLGDDGLPEGWEAGDLSAVSELNPESWSARNHPDEVEYIDLANTKWGTIESTARYAWADAPSRARRVVRPGDTVVGTVRPGNGSYAYIGQDGFTASTGFAVLRPKQNAWSPVVYCGATRRDNIENLASLADGGAYPAVRPDVVLQSPFNVPGNDVLDGFGEVLAPIFARMEHGKRENGTLAETRDLLLPKLMSGEIRLRDVEAVA